MKKKVKILIIILILILLFLILKSTYSKYTSEASGEVQANLGRWIIKVNDTDITEPNSNNLKEPVNFEVKGTDINWIDRDINVRENKLAPGMKGDLYIRILPETDTSLQYEFTLDATLLKDTNLSITDITLDNGKNFENGVTFESLNDDGKNKYSFTRKKVLSEIQDDEGNLLSDENRMDTIKISLEWETVPETDSQYNEYNKKDTLLGNRAFLENDVKLPITIKAIQYTGEHSE